MAPPRRKGKGGKSEKEEKRGKSGSNYPWLLLVTSIVARATSESRERGITRALFCRSLSLSFPLLVNYILLVRFLLRSLCFALLSCSGIVVLLCPFLSFLSLSLSAAQARERTSDIATGQRLEVHWNSKYWEKRRLPLLLIVVSPVPLLSPFFACFGSQLCPHSSLIIRERSMLPLSPSSMQIFVEICHRLREGRKGQLIILGLIRPRTGWRGG